MAADTLILASLSPFRAQLLKHAGIAFAVEGANIDERALEEEMCLKSPKELGQKLAEAKALDVSKRHRGALVIGCDQTLDLDGMVLHKVQDMEEARQRLLMLSGKTHYLHSGIALAKNGKIVWSDAMSAAMTMRVLAPDFIGRHLVRVEQKVLSSVGAYQIEGEGIQLFQKIEGDNFTIIGLPLLPLLEKLRNLGVIDG